MACLITSQEIAGELLIGEFQHRAVSGIVNFWGFLHPLNQGLVLCSWALSLNGHEKLGRPHVIGKLHPYRGDQMTKRVDVHPTLCLQ